jgi:membrane protein implicated in regulation of membrane protease activity
MRDSSKRVWTARLLAILVISFFFAFLVSIAPEKKEIFKKRVEIKANENVGEIVTAVENLGRDDIHIKVKDESAWYNKKPFFLWMGVGLFLSFSVILAIYHAIYCIISSLLHRKAIDDNLLKPTS